MKFYPWDHEKKLMYRVCGLVREADDLFSNQLEMEWRVIDPLPVNVKLILRITKLNCVYRTKLPYGQITVT